MSHLLLAMLEKLPDVALIWWWLKALSHQTQAPHKCLLGGRMRMRMSVGLQAALLDAAGSDCTVLISLDPCEKIDTILTLIDDFSSVVHSHYHYHHHQTRLFRLSHFSMLLRVYVPFVVFLVCSLCPQEMHSPIVFLKKNPREQPTEANHCIVYLSCLHRYLFLH